MAACPPRAQRLLDQLVKAAAAKPDARLELPRRIKPGSELVRTWNWRTYRVRVLEKGFAYDGKTFASLSEIATAITGTKMERSTVLRTEICRLRGWRRRPCRLNRPDRSAAPSTLANRPSTDWSRSSIPSTPNERPARPTSRAKPRRAGGSCRSSMTIPPIPVAISTALPSRSCSLISQPARSTWWWSTRLTA